MSHVVLFRPIFETTVPNSQFNIVLQKAIKLAHTKPVKFVRIRNKKFA